MFHVKRNPPLKILKNIAFRLDPGCLIEVNIRSTRPRVIGEILLGGPDGSGFAFESEEAEWSIFFWTQAMPRLYKIEDECC